MTKYRSGLEKDVASQLPEEWEYEALKMDYIVEHTYTPDFVHRSKRVMVEVKGFFRQGDRQKYKSVQKCRPDWELVFLFSDPNKRVQKNSRQTYRQWCERNGFKCFAPWEVRELIAYVESA